MHEECLGWMTWDQRIMRLEAQRVGTVMHDLHRPETTADNHCNHESLWMVLRSVLGEILGIVLGFEGLRERLASYDHSDCRLPVA